MYAQRDTQSLFILLATILLTSAVFSGGVAAQTDPVIEDDTVTTEGSTVTIDAADGASAVAVESFSPSDVGLTANDGGTLSSDGITWQGTADDGTVSFELTPPDSAEIGETIVFNIFDGEQTTTASVEIVPTNIGTVDINGSSVTIDAADGASAVAVESFSPSDVGLTANDGGTVSSEGITWQATTDDGTVSFELTPPNNAEDGDTITFDLFDGDQTKTVSVTVVSTSPVPTDFPSNADQYNAIIDEYGEISPITLAQLITDNAEQGDVGGVEFSPIELAEIVDWNASK